MKKKKIFSIKYTNSKRIVPDMETENFQYGKFE